MPLGPFWGFFPARSARRRLSRRFSPVLAFCWLLRLKIPDQFAEELRLRLLSRRLTLRYKYEWCCYPRTRSATYPASLASLRLTLALTRASSCLVVSLPRLTLDSNARTRREARRVEPLTPLSDNPRSSRWLRGQPRGSSLSTPSLLLWLAGTRDSVLCTKQQTPLLRLDCDCDYDCDCHGECHCDCDCCDCDCCECDCDWHSECECLPLRRMEPAACSVLAAPYLTLTLSTRTAIRRESRRNPHSVDGQRLAQVQ